MALDGVVKQTHDGLVVYCTLANKCFKENGCVAKGKDRTCLLSVNHGDRCVAWETVDTNKIKQLP